jgi:NADPH:quinone reductase-like Zn-dependent oxidoreductase
MKAVQLHEYGPADNLKYEEVPTPEPGPDEVLVKVAVTSINPIDWKLRSGIYKNFMPLQFPAILGHDVAGEVVKTGANVSQFREGQKVMGFANRSYAEYLTARADILAPVPEGMSMEQAGALPLVALTGAYLIEGAVKPKANDTVLITGAIGGVGRTAVFVAKQRGARVLAGVRGKQKDEAKRLGADEVVAIDDDREIASLPPLDAIADTVGGEVIGKLIPKLRKGGVLGSVLSRTPAAEGKDIRLEAFSVQPNAQRLKELAEAVQRGELEIPVQEVYPLREANKAHERAEKGGVGGKVLLLP